MDPSDSCATRSTHPLSADEISDGFMEFENMNRIKRMVTAVHIAFFFIAVSSKFRLSPPFRRPEFHFLYLPYFIIISSIIVQQQL